MTICHLGDLGHIPSQDQVEQLNDIDVLLVPIGGHVTLTGARAAEVVNILEPRIVIPMHYKVPGLKAKIENASRFLKEMAVETPERLDSLRITKGQLPEQTRVALLEPKQ